MIRLLCPLLVFILFLDSSATAQEDLLSELEGEAENKETIYTDATFKGTRLVNGHTVKTRSRGVLDFLISHRFGTVNSGFYELFGLDNSFIRLGLDYGITDRLNVGAGRSSSDKSYDTYVKYKVFRQQSGASTFPLTGTVLFSTAYRSSPRIRDNPDITVSNRISYSVVMLLARKFNSSFSLQLMPVFVHRNSVTFPEENDTYGLGVGTRYLITPSVSLNIEYYHRFGVPAESITYNPLSIGFDIETGGHVFQLHFTNSRGMMERAFVAETEGDIGSGDIYFGFNISRTFQLVK